MKLLDQIKERLVKEKVSVGIDIGSSAVKIVKLRMVKEVVELCGIQIEPMQLDLEALLKNMAKSQEAVRVNVSFSGPSTIIRYAQFMKMNEGELKQALKFEAQKHIPFSVSEVNVDGYILKPDLPDNKMLVLLAAVKKEYLNQRLKILESAGLRVQGIDLDSIALINAFNFNYTEKNHSPDKAAALLNIGAAQSNLSIIEDGIPRLSRDIPIAGNSFTQKIREGLGLELKAAEQLKSSHDPAKSAQVMAVLEPVIANLAAEVRISFDYFESQSASSVEKIYLSGGGSLFQGAKEMLHTLVGIEVEYWDPLKKVILSSNIDADTVSVVKSQLAVVIGLALRG
ncbi:MAG: type IV pilus assembly protein PilM [Candidatus Omnitrophota bacterium]|jgi:type IV pilus assembly protein PilM